MTRARNETIGTLGRSPARQSKASITPPLPSPDPEVPPERGTVARWLHAALFENVALKFLSLVLAVTVFLLVNTDRDSEISTKVALAYQSLPADKVLVSDRLEDVEVTIRGSWRRVRAFDEHKIEPIAIDLSRAPTGDIEITPDMIRTASGKLPVGLSVASISPRTVRVAFERSKEKLVEITPLITGYPKHGYVVTGVNSVPPTVKVRGGEGLVAALTTLRTREVPVDNATDDVVLQTQVVAPNTVTVEGSPLVEVHVTISEELVTRKLPGMPITIRVTHCHGGAGAPPCTDVDPAKWTVEPGKVDVTLTGALRAIERTKVITLVVNLTAGDGKAHDAPIAIEGVGPGIGVQLSPEHVRVTPVK